MKSLPPKDSPTCKRQEGNNKETHGILESCPYMNTTKCSWNLFIHIRLVRTCMGRNPPDGDGRKTGLVWPKTPKALVKIRSLKELSIAPPERDANSHTAAKIPDKRLVTEGTTSSKNFLPPVPNDPNGSDKSKAPKSIHLCSESQIEGLW